MALSTQVSDRYFPPRDARISIEVQKPGELSSEASNESLPPEPQEDSPARERDEAVTFYADGTADNREIRLEDRDDRS